jgi:hypothetical protein
MSYSISKSNQFWKKVLDFLRLLFSTLRGKTIIAADFFTSFTDNKGPLLTSYN